MTDDTTDPEESTPITRRTFIATTGAASTVGLAGCSGGGGGGGGGGESTEAESGSGGESGGTTGTMSGSGEPEKPDSLTVRAWGGAWQDNLDQYVSQPFTEETGIEIEYDNASEDQIQAQIRTALQQNREPPVNVQWSLTKTSYQSYQLELIDPLDTEVVPNVTELLGAAQPQVDGADWPFVNLYSYTYALTYNTDQVSSEPTSWSTWWDDEWENDIGLYPSGHGVTPVIAEMTDTEMGPVEEMGPVWEQYRELKPNVGTIGEDSQLTQSLRQGEVSMAVMLPANIVNAQDEGAPVDYTIPDEGARAGRDTMWIPKGQSESERYWGQKYINTAASPANIGPWCVNLGVAPLSADADVPDWMAEDVAFPTDEEQFNQMITPPLDVLTEHEPDWESRVNEIMGS
jgi:putative spermidine/putrescine transport system substrate-binding protein